MAIARKVKRIANPRRVKVKRRMKVRLGRNRLGRFVKAGRTRPKRRKAIARTVKRRVNRSRPRVSVRRRVIRRRRANPVLIELGALNPHQFTRRKRVARKIRSRKAVAIRRRRRVARVNPVRRRRRRVAVNRVHRRRRVRRSNPVVRVRRRRRTRRAVNGRVHRRRRVSHRRRNPAAFGHSGKALLMATGGVLVGVAATKYLPTLIPASITGMLGSSPFLNLGMTVAGAFAAQWIAKKVTSNSAFTDAVLLGGLAQAGSQLLNLIAPPQLSSALALSGLGDIVPGYFAVPQNSVTNRAPVMAMPAKSGMGAFKGAFGNRR